MNCRVRFLVLGMVLWGCGNQELPTNSPREETRAFNVNAVAEVKLGHLERWPTDISDVESMGISDAYVKGMIFVKDSNYGKSITHFELSAGYDVIFPGKSSETHVDLFGFDPIGCASDSDKPVVAVPVEIETILESGFRPGLNGLNSVGSTRSNDSLSGSAFATACPYLRFVSSETMDTSVLLCDETLKEPACQEVKAWAMVDIELDILSSAEIGIKIGRRIRYDRTCVVDGIGCALSSSDYLEIVTATAKLVPVKLF